MALGTGQGECNLVRETSQRDVAEGIGHLHEDVKFGFALAVAEVGKAAEVDEEIAGAVGDVQAQHHMADQPCRGIER